MAALEVLPYFPRPELLANVLRLLLSGAHVTLFAPRRQGKTEFVRKELMPAAHEAGWFTARVDLWRNRANPALGLVEGLEAIAGAKKKGKNVLTTPLNLTKLKTTFKTPGVDVEGEWEPAVESTPNAGATLENRLANALHTIASRSQHVLLVLDEFQALAKGDNDNFIAAFRTALQDLQGKLSVVYTGSSREGLNSMFRRSKAPLFQSAHAVTLPDLGDDFVDSRSDYLRDVAGIVVDRDQLKLLFPRLGHTPLFLNEIVRNMLLNYSGDIRSALLMWLDSKRDNEYNDLILMLEPLDAAVVVWLATGGEKSVYTADARQWMKSFLKRKQEPTTSMIQGAVRRLSKNEVVEPTGATGEYDLVDQGLMIFLREVAGTGIGEGLLAGLSHMRSEN